MVNGRRWLLIFAAIITSIIFIRFSPIVDQYVAALPYTPDTRVFYGELALWCKIVYLAVPLLTILMVLVPIVWLFISRHDKAKRNVVIKFSLIFYLTLILGPGLVVNAVFKDHWGRPRPYQVLRDGKTYSPFWVPHFTEKADNSFPGGHASIGFFIGVPLLALGRRKSAIAASIFGGTLVGCVRILQGGHYLSDVIFSGIFVWLIAFLVMYGVTRYWIKVGFSE